MTYNAIVSEIAQMPLNEQLMLLETITRLMREEVAVKSKRKSRSSLNRMLGILKPDGPMPTDQELKDDYTNYLIKKYL